jgi:hypothetical protein
MNTSKTIYSGQTILGNPAFGQLKNSNTAGTYIYTNRVQYQYCNPSRCVRVQNYKDLYALNASYRIKYTTLHNTIKSQKNNLISGLYTELDLKDVDVISKSTTNVSPTSITISSIPYLDYNIDPSGKLFGNTTCGLNNFINYRIGNNYTLNKILRY